MEEPVADRLEERRREPVRHDTADADCDASRIEGPVVGTASTPPKGSSATVQATERNGTVPKTATKNQPDAAIISPWSLPGSPASEYLAVRARPMGSGRTAETSSAGTA